MRKVILPIGAMVLLVALFFVGSSSQLTAIAISSFCLWTPASVWLGWSIAKSGVRVALVTTSPPPPKNNSDGDVVRRAIKRVQTDMGNLE
ncbi:MAG TPA: hypothetical protein PLZ51_27200 [Aggregatilineales bacterium]|nr:hypothetical protein [Aggregatilineales bacterium]